MHITKVNDSNIYEIKGTSKGTQPKFLKNEFWYKVDTLGKEGLAEWAVYNILKCSTLDISEYACYEPCEILFNNISRDGCKSKNFINGEQQIVTVYTLIKHNKFFMESLHKAKDLKEKFNVTVNMIYNLCNLDISDYLHRVLTLDAIVLNCDRHINNIAILKENELYKICPIFDNGASLGFDVLDRLDDYDNIIKYCEFTSPKFFGNRFEEVIELFGYGFQLYKKSIYDFIDLNYNYLGNMAEVFYYQLNKYKQILIN